MSARIQIVRRTVLGSVLCIALSCLVSAQPAQRTFASPDDAARALVEAVRSSNLDKVIAIFGPDGRELAESSDAATGRLNREIFVAAVGEGWHLVDAGANRKTLVIGNEDWPFPVPIAKAGAAWHFDTAAGREEVIARRIGRNELSAIAICHTYVAAQRHYASVAHDGKRAGLYAAALTSAPGKQNGLYWPDAHGQPRSPLGDLVAQAATEGQTLGGEPRVPFHGYYFRILTAQGAHAKGGKKSYVTGGDLVGGFALVAWPAQYDVTGVMTFLVSLDGVVRQKDLGPETATSAAKIAAYDPDASWHAPR
jgi:hypothetical protein